MTEKEKEIFYIIEESFSMIENDNTCFKCPELLSCTDYHDEREWEAWVNEQNN